MKPDDESDICKGNHKKGRRAFRKKLLLAPFIFAMHVIPIVLYKKFRK